MRAFAYLQLVLGLLGIAWAFVEFGFSRGGVIQFDALAYRICFIVVFTGMTLSGVITSCFAALIDQQRSKGTVEDRLAVEDSNRWAAVIAVVLFILASLLGFAHYAGKL